MKIIQAEQNDLKEILILQYLAYQSESKLLNNPSIPPLKQTIEEIKQEYLQGIFLKAVNDVGVIIGSVRAYAKNGTLFIGKLIVNPGHQGQGIGTKLLYAIEQTHPDLRYELFTSNKSVKNIMLYKRLGYVPFRDEIITPDLGFIYLEKIVNHE